MSEYDGFPNVHNGMGRLSKWKRPSQPATEKVRQCKNCGKCEIGTSRCCSEPDIEGVILQSGYGNITCLRWMELEQIRLANKGVKSEIVYSPATETVPANEFVAIFSETVKETS